MMMMMAVIDAGDVWFNFHSFLDILQEFVIVIIIFVIIIFFIITFAIVIITITVIVINFL